MENNQLPFIHLRVKSSYSLAEGAITPINMVKLAKENSMPAVAITDRCNMFGSLEFSSICASEKIQPIIGATIPVLGFNKDNDNLYEVLLIAKDYDGYHNLLKIVSRCYTQTKDNEKPHIKLTDLKELNNGLIILTGGLEGPVNNFIKSNLVKTAKQNLEILKDIFQDRLYVEIIRTDPEYQIATEDKLLDLAYELNLPIVATNDVYFADEIIHQAHDILLCIAAGKVVDEEDRRKISTESYFKSSRKMNELFEDLPEAIENTYKIMQRCSVMSLPKPPILPKYAADGSSEDEAFIKIAKEGLEKRLKDHVILDETDKEKISQITKPYYERLDFELNIITKMNFAGYFLIVSDFMRWSNRNNVPVGPGRGSGAGSLVAWSMEITDLDPLRFGLLFERFLNPERVSMPDFDIDFCQEKRERVIKYVQGKYGFDKVAQIITFGKLQAKAVLRDVGRVLQMPYSQVDRISKMIPFNPIDPVTLQKALDMDKGLRDLKDSDPEIGHLINIALKLEGLNRHSSTHAAGVVIGDRPLEELVPVYCDPRSEMPVCGYSMKYAEMAGLVKFDFLGLKTLTVIAKTVELLKLRDIDLDISKIDIEDKLTFTMLGSGKSVGVFQLESAGMRDTLRKMKPDNIDDIIALISLYRPGPMDNIPSYIARKHGLEKPDYLHPMLEEVLKETYGVIIYQEQVMQIAQIMGGYSLGAADLLRRAMGKKIAAEMDKQRNIFVSGAIENKVDKDQASAIFDLVAKFAGYGFNKSHAAAYALISYRTAFLKANYLVEFLIASMNLEIQDTDKINIFISDAKNHDVEILLPNINKSRAYFYPEKNNNGSLSIRYGLGALKNVGIAAIEKLVEEREKNGDFTSIYDFIMRSSDQLPNKRMLENLVKSGAFDKLHPNRKQLVDNIETLLKFANADLKQKASPQMSLFSDEESSQNIMPKIPENGKWNKNEQLQEEFNAVGLYLEAHPFDSHIDFLSRSGVVTSSYTNSLSDGYHNLEMCGVVISKKMRSSPKGKFANVSLSDTDGIYEISVYDEDIFIDCADLMEPGQLVILAADVKKDEGGIRVTAKNISSLDEKIASKKIHYKIYLESLCDINKIRSLVLKSENNKTLTKLSFIFNVNNKQVTIDTAENIFLPVDNFEEIKDLNSVQKIDEVMI